MLLISYFVDREVLTRFYALHSMLYVPHFWCHLGCWCQESFSAKHVACSIEHHSWHKTGTVTIAAAKAVIIVIKITTKEITSIVTQSYSIALLSNAQYLSKDSRLCHICSHLFMVALSVKPNLPNLCNDHMWTNLLRTKCKIWNFHLDFRMELIWCIGTLNTIILLLIDLIIKCYLWWHVTKNQRANII